MIRSVSSSCSGLIDGPETGRVLRNSFVEQVKETQQNTPAHMTGRREWPDPEGADLTTFLLAAVADVYSVATIPPLCPHCGTTDTRCASRPRERFPLPTFRCRRCASHFTRLTCTPIANTRRKDLVLKLIPLLSQPLSLTHVAVELGVSRQCLIAHVERFRKWLLLLDPSGQYERRVRLGLESV